MQAVIRTGGKQYIVEPGQTLEVELLDSNLKQVEFEPLLVMDSDKISIGTPLVDGVKVKADVLGEVKGDKIKVLKFKAKKRVKKLTGHRQHYTQIKITAVGTATAKEKSATAKAATPAAKPKAKVTA